MQICTEARSSSASNNFPLKIYATICQGKRVLYFWSDAADWPPNQLLILIIKGSELPVKRGSSGGSVGRAVASDSRGPQIKSSHWQTFVLNICLLSTILKILK